MRLVAHFYLIFAFGRGGGRYFFYRQKEGLLNSVLSRSLELLDGFSLVLWRGLDQLILLDILLPSPLEIESLGGLL